jgi:hypothetical protein
MIYRKDIQKISPMPGRFTAVQMTHFSAVDSGANLKPVLAMKRSNNEMNWTEIEKKELKEAGYTDEEIAKMSAPVSFKDKIAKFLGLGGSKSDPTPAPAASEAPLTLEAIQKAVEKTIDEKLSVLKSNDSTPAPDDTAELARIQKEIDDEAVKQSQVNDISKQLEIKKQELAEAKAKTEEIMKMRVPGNAGFQANEQQAPLSAEEAEISKRHEPFKGTALDFSSLRIS